MTILRGCWMSSSSHMRAYLGLALCASLFGITVTAEAQVTDPTRPITAVQPAAQDEPIVVNEPEPANTRREDGDESLRELFWGEEG